MVPITTSGSRRRERAGESGLRWGSFALWRAQKLQGRCLPDPSSAAAALPLRRVDASASPLGETLAQRSYPQGK